MRKQNFIGIVRFIMHLMWIGTCFSLFLVISDSFLNNKPISSFYNRYIYKAYLEELPIQYVYTMQDFSQLTQNSEKITSTKFYTTDPRVVALKRFLTDYGSPAADYADVFVIEADKTGLDWRLVASISGVESAFCKLKPYGSNNCWGWKGGPNLTWSIFPTYREGVETVTAGLANGYGINLTPYEIGPTYCPDCFEQGNYAWADGVQSYMNELSYYLSNLNNI